MNRFMATGRRSQVPFLEDVDPRLSHHSEDERDGTNTEDEVHHDLGYTFILLTSININHFSIF